MGRVRQGLLAVALLLAPTAPLGAAQEGQEGKGGQEEAVPEEESPEAQTGWGGAADVGFTLTEGNSQTTNVSLGMKLINELERQRWGFSASFVRATSEGEETANRASATGRYDFFPRERFFLFARIRGGFNRPAGIDLRLQPSLGAGYVLARSGRVTLSLEGGMSWVSERFQNDSTSNALFASLGEALSVEINRVTSLSQTVAYSPRTEDPGDYLLHIELSFSTFFAEPVGLKVSVIDEFDSSPFVDEEGNPRKKNDITFVTAVTFRF